MKTSLVMKRQKPVLPKFNLITLIVYRLTLELIYIFYIVPVFGYSGFNYEFDMSSYVNSWLVLLLIYPFIRMNYKKEKASYAIITILYLVSFIPGTIILAFMLPSTSYNFLFVLYWTFLSISNIIIPHFYIKKPNYNTCQVVTYTLILFFTIIILYISWKYTNFRLNFSLLNVYSLRDEALNFDLPVILVYGFSAAKVFMPIAFVYMISASQKKMAFFIAVIQFLAFSVDGSKSTLFALVFTYIGYKFIKNLSIHLFAKLLLVLNSFALIENFVFGTIYLIIIFIRRVMFLPNLLNLYYYDFFSRNAYDYFRQGIVGRLGFDSPYNISISNIIGGAYFNSPTMMANNGLFSDAYSNLGITGILIMPFVLVIAMRFLDACSNGIKSSILIACIVTSAYTFLSSSFFTVMLTHGFLIVCISLLFLPQKK